MAIPDVEDYRKLTWKIWASFEIPKAWCQALKVTNDYSTPPAPKCIERKLFLLAPDSRLPNQDYHKQQPLKTYVQALQHWAERANLPNHGKSCWLAKCVQESREIVKPFTTFMIMRSLERKLLAKKHLQWRLRRPHDLALSQLHNLLCWSHGLIPHQLLNQQLPRKQREPQALCPPTGLRSTHLTQLPLYGVFPWPWVA